MLDRSSGKDNFTTYPKTNSGVTTNDIDPEQVTEEDISSESVKDSPASVCRSNSKNVQ